jgi:hypothetical protein
VREQIEKRLAELKAARDLFVAEANQRIAAFNGAIGELEALLKAEEAEGSEGEGATAETGIQ